VDEVVGEREIVIKRLPAPLQAVPNISGATLTGNGEIMMVLNVDDLIDNAQRQQGRALGSSHDERSPITVDRRLHVLVVDDSVTTRTLEKNMLESHGFRVSVATDGLAGWELLQKDTFALVITDVEMPRLNGFELTEKIRKSGRFPQLPVIIVTSLAKESDRRRGVEAGADAYLVKSDFESRALLDIVRQLI
jgi:CheY-like chemotaxis protein